MKAAAAMQAQDERKALEAELERLALMERRVDGELELVQFKVDNLFYALGMIAERRGHILLRLAALERRGQGTEAARAEAVAALGQGMTWEELAGGDAPN